MVSTGRSAADDGVDQSLLVGRVNFVVDGRILYAEATGPFNKELIGAVMDTQRDLFVRMTADGPWGQIVIFKNSLLAGPDATSFFAEHLRAVSEQGISPKVTALVLAPGLEGACVLIPRLADAYESAQRIFEIFPNKELATEWVLKKLNDFR